MRVRVRISPALLFWKRRRRLGEDGSILTGKALQRGPLGERSERQPAISVTCAPGDRASGPTVALGVQLAGRKGLLIEMKADEATDLASELLLAVQMSERKYQLRFG